MTGEPGTDVRVEQSGTPEEPQITLTIPRGDTGSLENLSINGRRPDADGTVTLASDDVGAYKAGGIRKLTFSLPVSAWTGESAFSAEIAESSITAQTWIEIAPDAASEENYSKDIIWETSAGRITLTTTAKPTGTLAGTMILTEVEG